MADIKAIAEELVNLTVKEVNELATVLKDEYGIEPAAAAVAVADLPAASGRLRRTHNPDRGLYVHGFHGNSHHGERKTGEGGGASVLAG